MESATVPGRTSAPALPAALRSPLWLVAVATVLAGVLRVHMLGTVRTDPYYEAAVRSMGHSWHDFFFAAYEPGGGVAVDKPPLDLWLQVASTKLLGFRPLAMLLPQALAGTLAVPLLYDAVRRVSGSLAGLGSALALAVLPVSVLTARSDTMDSLAMALSVLALWLVVLAAQRGRARYLYLAAVVFGLGFDTKSLEALIAVPALALLYWLALPLPRGRRAAHLGIAAAVLAAGVLWWPAAVSLAPASARPYVLGSTDGSVWNALFVYNGVGRLSPPRKDHAAKRPNRARPAPTRLFSKRSRFAPLVGVELLAALVLGGLAAAFSIGRGTRAPPSRPRTALAVAVAAWLLPAVAVYSAVAQLHPRYLESISPPIAIAIGIGLTALLREAARRRAALVALMLAIALVAAYALAVQPAGSAAAAVAAIAAGLTALAVVLAPRPVAAALALVALLAVPVARSADVVRSGATDSGHPGKMASARVAAISRYLAPRTRGAAYEAAATSYLRAAPLIAHDGRAVLVLDGPKRHQIVGASRLRAAVRAGDVRYAIVGGPCGAVHGRRLSHCPRVVRLVRAHAVDASKAAGLPSRGLLFRFRRGF